MEEDCKDECRLSAGGFAAPGIGRVPVVVFDEEKCIACRGCEVACKSWRPLGPGISRRSVRAVSQDSYPYHRSTYVSVACIQCVDPACMDACPEGAISRHPNRGTILVDEGVCTGCTACLDACPLHVPEFSGDGTMVKCDMCVNESDLVGQEPPCVATCPTKALSFVSMDERDRRSMEDRMEELIAEP
jgi:anaerobic dimethyl sulfoxide reductase subunit B